MKVTVSNDNRPVLWLYGEIGNPLTGVMSQDFVDALKDIPSTQPVDVRINSPGGSFGESIAIYSLLTGRQAPYNSIIDSEASSGGSVVAVGGKKITMRTGSWMMIHEARGTAKGATASDMRANADHLDSINDQLVQIYKPRWKGTEQELRAALNAETWMRDSQALAMGMADSIDSGMSVAAYAGHSKFKYRCVPEAVLQAESNRISPFESISEAGKTVERIFAGIGK